MSPPGWHRNPNLALDAENHGPGGSRSGVNDRLAIRVANLGTTHPVRSADTEVRPEWNCPG
jgi:hypothetical protein